MVSCKHQRITTRPGFDIIHCVFYRRECTPEGCTSIDKGIAPAGTWVAPTVAQTVACRHRDTRTFVSPNCNCEKTVMRCLVYLKTIEYINCVHCAHKEP
jgi:hypothetical protein